MSRMYRLRLLASRVVGTGRALPRIAQLARRPDHREMPVERKPAFRQFLELTYVSLRWGEVSNAYHVQGIDRVDRRLRRDYLPYPVFRRIRDSRNRSSGTGAPFDYVCLLQDKLLFARYFGAGGLPVIPTVCEMTPSLRLTFDDRSDRPLSELTADFGAPLSLFCKPRFGIHGTDAFRLDIRDEGLFVNGDRTSEEALARRVHEPCLCQRRIHQHEDMGRLHPESVNTLRVVTYGDGGHPEVFMVALKLGAGGHVTDNGGDSRYVVRVHADTGRLYDTGIWICGDRIAETTTHGSSGLSFGDCTVPHFARCLELARQAHAWLPGTCSVGWDLVVTPDGPKLLEGNDDWSGSTSMGYPDVRESFLQRYRGFTPAPSPRPLWPSGPPAAH